MAQVSEPQNAAAAAPNGNADGVAAITEALEATNLELGRKVSFLFSWPTHFKLFFLLV